MKKLALALCLLAVSFTAQAQFEKGTTIINPSLSGLDFSYSKNDKAKFGVGAQVGTFFAEGIALMVNAGADWSKPIDEYTLGTGVRFYFNKTGIYLGGGLDWNRFRWSGGKHQTDWGLGIEAGYAYFLSRTVTIEPAVYYKWRFNGNHTIFRHANFIGCLSADKIKMPVRKYFCFNIPVYRNMAEEPSCRSPYHEEYIQTSVSGNSEGLCRSTYSFLSERR